MNAGQIQQQLAINAQVLTGLHEEHQKLKKERARFNAMGDAEKAKTNNAATQEEVEGFTKNAEMFYGQAAIFTPWVKKFAKKIATMAAIQVALKHELSCIQCLTDWEREDEQFLTEHLFDEPDYFAAVAPDAVGWVCHGEQSADGQSVVWGEVKKFTEE